MRERERKYSELPTWCALSFIKALYSYCKRKISCYCCVHYPCCSEFHFVIQHFLSVRLRHKDTILLVATEQITSELVFTELHLSFTWDISWNMTQSYDSVIYCVWVWTSNTMLDSLQLRRFLGEVQYIYIYVCVCVCVCVCVEEYRRTEQCKPENS